MQSPSSQKADEQSPQQDAHGDPARVPKVVFPVIRRGSDSALVGVRGGTSEGAEGKPHAAGSDGNLSDIDDDTGTRARLSRQGGLSSSKGERQGEGSDAAGPVASSSGDAEGARAGAGGEASDSPSIAGGGQHTAARDRSAGKAAASSEPRDDEFTRRAAVGEHDAGDPIAPWRGSLQLGHSAPAPPSAHGPVVYMPMFPLPYQMAVAPQALGSLAVQLPLHSLGLSRPSQVSPPEPGAHPDSTGAPGELAATPASRASPMDELSFAAPAIASAGGVSAGATASPAGSARSLDKHAAAGVAIPRPITPTTTTTSATLLGYVAATPHGNFFIPLPAQPAAGAPSGGTPIFQAGSLALSTPISQAMPHLQLNARTGQPPVSATTLFSMELHAGNSGRPSAVLPSPAGTARVAAAGEASAAPHPGASHAALGPGVDRLVYEPAEQVVKDMRTRLVSLAAAPQSTTASRPHSHADPSSAAGEAAVTWTVFGEALAHQAVARESRASSYGGAASSNSLDASFQPLEAAPMGQRLSDSSADGAALAVPLPLSADDLHESDRSGTSGRSRPVSPAKSRTSNSSMSPALLAKKAAAFASVFTAGVAAAASAGSKAAASVGALPSTPSAAHAAGDSQSSGHDGGVVNQTGQGDGISEEEVVVITKPLAAAAAAEAAAAAGSSQPRPQRGRWAADSPTPPAQRVKGTRIDPTPDMYSADPREVRIQTLAWECGLL